jgi:glutamate-5-semialdehyde dehydrogenase
MASLSSEVKDRALRAVACDLEAKQKEIVAANARDMQAGKENGLSESLLDRLLLTPERIKGMADGVRDVVMLPDPVGEEFDGRTLPNGLRICRRRVPLGVIGSIYESRPNVTVDIAALALKSGNACILRAGREAINSVVVLGGIIREAIAREGIPADAVQIVDNPDRVLVEAMLKMREHIDLMVPRGSAGFIRFVVENATMPVVAGGIGVCHVYVDRSANLQSATDIAYNAKVQRPSVCNAMDTLLVHAEVATRYLPMIAAVWSKAGVEMRCDRRALSILAANKGWNAKPARPDDFGTEFLALIAAMKVVDSLDEALEHIVRYGSGHSEAIVTEDYSAAQRFVNEVDASAVFVNASTRFNDGGQFGLGAEVGISTQKFHARGPMGLRELTSYKWVVLGSGHVRP